MGDKLRNTVALIRSPTGYVRFGQSRRCPVPRPRPTQLAGWDTRGSRWAA